MKTGYLSHVGNVEIKDFDVPLITETEVLIKVEVSGICGSDLHAFHGKHPFRKAPMILGHEVAGKVVKVGSEVSSIEVGDRVTVEPLKNCGECSHCKSGSYHLCDKRVSAGTENWLGSFAEFFKAPADKVYVLPDKMSYELGMLVEPLAVGVHAAKLSRFKEGEKALVLGTGPIGLLNAVALQETNPDGVLCTDINDFRLNKAKEFGIHTVNVANESLEERKAKMAPDGFDVVILTVTSPAVVDQALQMVKKGGRIIVVTLFSEKIPFDLGKVQINEIEVKGSMIYTKEDFEKALEILTKRGEKLSGVITHSVGLNGVNHAMQLLTDPDNQALKICVTI